VGSNSRQRDPRGSRHFLDNFHSLEEIGLAADAARSLVASPGWQILTGLVEAEIATIDRSLDSRTPLPSRADYAALGGRRGGLRAVPLMIEALIEHADAKFEEQRKKHEGAAEPVPIGVS
jgi:hypothetical protein